MSSNSAFKLTREPRQEAKDTASGTATTPDFGLGTNGQRAVDLWLRSNEALMKATFELAQQMVTFGQARLEADMTTWDALTHCKNIEEILECQKAFTEKATAEYLDQANLVTSRLGDLFTSAINPLLERGPVDKAA